MNDKVNAIRQRSFLEQWGWTYQRNGIWKRGGLRMLRTDAVKYTEQYKDYWRGRYEKQRSENWFHCPHCGGIITIVAKGITGDEGQRD